MFWVFTSNSPLHARFALTSRSGLLGIYLYFGSFGLVCLVLADWNAAKSLLRRKYYCWCKCSVKMSIVWHFLAILTSIHARLVAEVAAKGIVCLSLTKWLFPRRDVSLFHNIAWSLLILAWFARPLPSGFRLNFPFWLCHLSAKDYPQKAEQRDLAGYSSKPCKRKNPFPRSIHFQLRN